MNTQNETTKNATPADVEQLAAKHEEHIPSIDELNPELQDIFRTTAARYGITI